MSKLRPLPTDISTFSDLIKQNCMYVDKTEYIYKMLGGVDRYYFLARPRRFGKSLLVSTLKELFFGNKELFKDLWIEKSSWKWEQHPIIHLDFSKIAHETSIEF